MAENYIRDLLLTARMQALLCKAVYGSRYGVYALASELGVRFRWFEVGNNCAGALLFDDHVHLSVCGSNDRYDWIQNADTDEKSVGVFTAHRGFVRGADDLKKAILKSDIMPMINGFPSKPLVIGGHSAGGAIAQLLSLEDRLFPREIITFGAPKVFSNTSAVTYAAGPWNMSRFVMHGDLIPFLPLRIGAAIFRRPRYVHSSIPTYIRDDGTLESDDTTMTQLAWARLKQFINLGFASLSTIAGMYSKTWKQHSIDRYLDAINKGVSKYV